MTWQDIQSQVENLSPQSIIKNHHNQWTSVLDRCKRLLVSRMRLVRHVKKRRHLAKVCRSGRAQTPRHGSPKGTSKGTGKGSGKGKSKKRTPETCLRCGKQRHKNADCKFKTATCSNCGMVGHLKAVCRNTNTNTRLGRMQMAKHFDTWLFTVEDSNCDCIDVCRNTCVLDCLEYASWYVHFALWALVWATHGLSVVRAPQCAVGVLAGTHCGALRCPGRMASGAECQPFVVVLCWW